jgi:hypothetical protein
MERKEMEQLRTEKWQELVSKLDELKKAAGHFVTALSDTVGTVAEWILADWRRAYRFTGLKSRWTEKQIKQESIRDRKKQLQRSCRRQKLLQDYQDESNNWKRMHGLHSRRSRTLRRVK